MRYFIRKVVRGNKNKGQYHINLPKEVIEKLELSDSHVTLEVKGKILYIDKIKE